LISLSIHPLFVFDGPNKPPFKRNKRTGPNVASIPEFLAKQLLKQFGIPFHLAPGEAEAECALLQMEGVVDAVLSEDVDTLMFGSGLTFRNWTPEASKSKVPTHVNLYDATVTKETSGMDREGMILVALMSGGDYVPEGIPGCGPKTACEAARAGFGYDLCQISRRDRDGLSVWREKLAHELHTNESKFFKQKHKKLAIPDDFPSTEVLGYYTHPAVSPLGKVEKLRRELKWDMDIDFKELRTFTEDAFDWTKLGGAKKFIRNLAPALLVRELRMRGEELAKRPIHEAEAPQGQEKKFVQGIHGTRNHASTDGITELRITFTPHELVPIDLDAEELDDEINQDISDDEGNLVPISEAPGSPSKPRAPSTYDPRQAEKLWVFQAYVSAGAPCTVRNWVDRAKNARTLVETRSANGKSKRTEREKKKKNTTGGMQNGALNKFAKITKPGIPSSAPKSSQPPSSIQHYATVTKPGSTFIAPPKPSQDLPPRTQGHRWKDNGTLEVSRSLEPEISTSQIETIDLFSSSPARQTDTRVSSQPVPQLSSEIPELLPSTVTKRRRSPLRRWQTDTAVLDLTSDGGRSMIPTQDLQQTILSSPCSLPSPSQLWPVAKKAKVPKIRAAATLIKPAAARCGDATATTQAEAIAIPSSPTRQADLSDYFSPRKRAAQRQQQPKAIENSRVVTQISLPEEIDLTTSPTRKPVRRSPCGFVSSQPMVRVAAPLTQELELIDADAPLPPPEQIKSTFKVPPSSIPVQRGKEKEPGHTVAASQAMKKTVYRIRDSLPGTFAIEEVDLTNNVGTKNVRVKKGRKFRHSEISILDLTGD
jgi:Holliday junction resolvase YEN1